VNLRPEEPRDFEAIRALDLAAFAPSVLEADITERLRAATDHVPDLCLVAVEDDETVRGHVTLSRAHVGEYPALGLGPIAVDPAHQHHGIGGALMREAIERARRTEYPLIALLGHPAYYPPFGFRPAERQSALTFSDFSYTEIVMDVDPHPDPITIDSDPYLIIRPEGQWHRPGVLEESAKRPVTSPLTGLRQAVAACPMHRLT